MNCLSKSFFAFIFFIFSSNMSLAISTETAQPDLEKVQEITTPVNTKIQTASLLKRIYSKTINIVKAGTKFVKSNPKKCLIITAAIISSAILCWYLSQIMVIQPSKTWEQLQEKYDYNFYKTYSECPNNKALEEAMINMKKNHMQIDYTKKTTTNFEWCVYHDAGNQSIRTYCDPTRQNDNAQNIHLMPAEIDYIYKHGNQIVRQAIDYLKSRAASYCEQPSTEA